MKKQNKKYNIYLAIAIILILFSVYLLFLKPKPFEVEFLLVKFEVRDRIGLILNESELNFGSLLQGASATKKVDITNDYGYPIKVKILISKNMKEFVFTEPEVYISPGEMAVLSFLAVVPNDMEEGNYSGQVRFDFYKED